MRQTLLPLLLLALTACGSPMPDDTLGVSDGQLSPCPDSPNCVSSQAPPSDSRHHMDPIPFTGSADDAMRVVRQAVEGMARSRVVAQEGRYLHAEFRSLVFRFVDDVEVYIDDAAQLIHFRSAARLGQGDMGVNRRRMTTLGERLRAALSG